MIFFMNTIFNDFEIIELYRRKSIKTFTKAKTSRIVFDDKSIKKLFISNLIDLYNHFMNEMNVTNQLRCYYDTQRVYFKI